MRKLKCIGVAAIPMCMLIGGAASVHATVLTFDIFSDSGKSTTLTNGSAPTIQNYGDNVNNFSPTGSFDAATHYYNYGSAGGLTPGVAVEYRWFNPSNSADNGLTAVNFYTTGFGDLTNVIVNAQPLPYHLELRFIPAVNHAVTLNSFDMAGFGANKTVPTIRAVRDVNTGSEVDLWGPFTNTVVSGSTHTSFAPNVSVIEGHTLSLIFGTDSAKVIAIDNINFSQTVIPEPAGVAVVVLGVVALRRGRR